MQSKPLQGSERSPLPGSRATGKANPAERFEVTVIVRRRARNTFAEGLNAAVAGDRSRRVKHEDFAREYGADANDTAIVKRFAERYGLAVVLEDLARRTVKLSGTVEQFSAAFGVQLETYEHANGTYRGRVGSIMLEEDLHDVVEAVLGLDNRPQAQPHFRIRSPRGNVTLAAKPTPANSEYTPTDLASIYAFPASSGAGECIAIIELGGGYRPADLKKYFAKIETHAPTVTAVSIDHAANAPVGNPNSADGEVMLDIEVAGAIAPEASIVVYFAPNTDAGFLDAITTAIHDTQNKPSVISISWGGPESTWTTQTMDAFNAAFQSAATLGITVCVAAGDNGSSDGVTTGGNHVDFPASSPYALACGGTSLRTAGTTITSETVWNDGAQGGAGGGGVSAVFPVPAWQAHLRATATTGQSTELAFRGVPDVAGDADPETGYEVIVDGTSTVIGGTSAVAPLWAGLIARLNAINKESAGLIHPVLYANPNALRDVTQGNNGAFEATSGWDACTGLGTPNGAAIERTFRPARETGAHATASA
jgi:kumamolisin